MFCARNEPGSSCGVGMSSPKDKLCRALCLIPRAFLGCSSGHRDAQGSNLLQRRGHFPTGNPGVPYGNLQGRGAQQERCKSFKSVGPVQLTSELCSLDSYTHRVIGCLLGAACGDTLEAAVEGKDYESIQYRFPHGLTSFSHSERPFGCYTDDTEMMIALARSLVEEGHCSSEAAARQYAELFTPSRGYGSFAAKALNDIKNDCGNIATIARKYIHEGSYGNGGAMRIAPVGLAYRHAAPAVLRKAVEDALLCTHVHPLAIDGAAIQAAAVAALSQADSTTATPAWLLGHLMPLAQTEDMREWLQTMTDALSTWELKQREAQVVPVSVDGHDLSLDLPGDQPPDCAPYFKSKLWDYELNMAGRLGGNFQIKAPDAVATSLWALICHWNDPASAIVAAVHYGGDTDTIACMTGALVGALHGLSWLPRDWWEHLENGPLGRDYLALKLGPELAQLDCK